MAGSELAISTHSELENSTLTSQVSAVINEWQVRFGRFISYNPSEFTSTHPCLTPRTSKHGIWMSTASASASVKLIYACSPDGLDDAVLVLSLRSEILEEHFISKMHFSWPQTSCNPGYPAKGTRAILVSYKDGVHHLQRFSLQFLTNYEAEDFMNIVKEILKNGSPQLLQSHEFNSEVSSQTDDICSQGPAYKPKREWQNTTSENNSNQLMHPSSDLTEYAYKPKGGWQHTTSEDNSNQLMHPSSEMTEYTYKPKGEWQHTTSKDSSNQLMHPHPELTEHAYKPKGEWQHTSEDNSNQLMHPTSELTEYSVSTEGIKDHEAAEAMSAFPPSFTEMMKNCNPAVAEAKLTESGDLTSQFVQYLEGTTFKELLDTVENVISQLGDDMVL